MLCWLQLKGHTKEHNKKVTLSAVKDLTYEGFWRVEPEQCKRTSVMLEINKSANLFNWSSRPIK